MKQAVPQRYPIAHTALWLYVGPRLFVLATLVAVCLLAGFLVFAQVARDWLVRWGA
jgi:hypothetical protein